MKCRKLTFISPLNGSVYCEGLVNEDDNRVDFGPYGVLQLYNRDEQVLLTLTEECQELKNYVPDELLNIVVSAVFGNTVEHMGGLYLATEIYVSKDLADEQYALLCEWIIGQLSDGWGERLEQVEVFREHVTFTHTVFDEDILEFTEEEEIHTAHYYIHPWQYGPEWRLELLSTEDAELDDEPTELETVLKEINENLLRIVIRLNELA